VLNDASGTLVLSGGDPYSGGFGNSVCYGCTDPLSADYDASVLFDNGSCTYPCLDADTTESFETDLGAWNQDAGDDVDWIRDSGGTPSSGTGPTTGLDGSYYLFMESSGSYLKTANLTLDCVDPTAWSAASLVFGYHMYGLTTGTLNVDVSTDNGANWTNVWTLAGDQGNVWNEATVDLSTYTSQIDVRIQGITGTSNTSDIAIDLTRLMEIPASGCTNPLASNYDANASMDDGSCTYSNCVSLTVTMNDSYGDGWNGNAFVVTDANGWQYLNATISTGSTGTATVCVPDNVCYTITCGGGSYPTEVSWILTDDATGIDVLTGGAPYTGSYCTPIASGCTDVSAVNYDAAAFVDDGSCLYSSTFNVEMNCEDQLSFTTVSLESPVFGWCGGCVPMTDPDGDGIYSVTIDLPLGSFEHKYATDNFAGQENLIDDMVSGGTCAPITDYYSYANREAIISVGHVSNDTYSSCGICIIPGCTDTTATNFNTSAQTDDGSCTYDVTFSVDLRCSGVNPTVVTATGDYDNWSGNTYNLSDADGDGIWEGTYNMLAGTFQFLYITDNYTTTEINGLINSMQNGATCAPNTDNLTYAYRMLTIGNLTTSDTYARCEACVFGCTDAAASNYDANAELDDASCLYATTFSVNMNCEPLGSFGYVHLESPVFGWCGGCVPMTDADGDGIHTVTVDLPLGDFEYKYAVDGFAGQEDLIDDMVNGGTCAPITDYYSYANRQLTVSVGASTDDVYGSCDACNTVNGCMDADASNYNSSANVDDGTCLFSTTFNVDMNCEPAGSFGYVHLESPLFGWCGGCVPMTDADGDGVHSVTVDLAQGAFEYKYAVDGFAGQEDLIDDMVNGGNCAPVTDYYSYANRQFDVNGRIFDNESVQNGGFDSDTMWVLQNGSSIAGAGNVIANGNIASAAGNWGVYQNNVFDVSKNYLVTFSTKQLLGSGRFQLGQGYNKLFDQVVSANWTEYSVIVYSSDFQTLTNSINALSTGGSNLGDIFQVDNISVLEFIDNPFTTNDAYGSCSECLVGCMDPLAWNYDSLAGGDDGSCLYSSDCSNTIPTNLGVNWTTDTKASINWDNMNIGDCRVIKYFTRYRTGGSNSWSVKSAGIGSGLCNVGLDVTDKILQNLNSGEIYEFQMKAFYCGGGVSGWSGSSYFATGIDCPELTNLAVETFTQNHAKAKFTWDTTGSYLFARVALRVDTVGSSWQTAGGFGVYYPTLTVNKFGLTSGQSYRAQGRTFCDANITSYRSTWTAPMFWTQPGVLPSRIDGGTASINNFDVYPNPSSDLFNVSFVSDKVQDLNIRVVNMIGEVVYVEGLEKFVGEYTKQINLNGFTKGVYFLEITTNNGVVNKKIVLQ
jgi:hypothetical protein